MRRCKESRPAIGAITSKATCTVKDLGTLVSDCRKFRCIHADPPWRYSNQATRSATNSHYDSMTLEQLLTLPVSDLASSDSHLEIEAAKPRATESIPKIVYLPSLLADERRGGRQPLLERVAEHLLCGR